MILTFTDENDNCIYIQYGIANSVVYDTDNEHSKRHDVYVNGHHAVLYESDNDETTSKLIWVARGYCFVINAQLEMDEFVKIAKSIKFD